MGRSTLIALMITAIVTTAVLFLAALIVEVLGPAAIYFVYIVCIPAELILLFLDIVLICVSLSAALHLLRLRRADEEHRMRMLQERREIDLKIRGMRLIEHRHRVKKLRIAARRYHLLRRQHDKRQPVNDS